MAQFSSNLLFLSFILYLVSIFFFGGAIRDKKGEAKQNRWALIGISITIVGFVSHLGYFILRWIAGGHAPVSNLFEFLIAFAMMLVGAFIFIYFIYKSSALGLFTLPIVLIIIAYGSMFSNEITPLIPALQTNWLILHVITAALGEAILAVSFGAGLIYLIKTVNHSKKSKQTFWLEIIMYGLISVLGFVFVTVGFKAMDFNQTFAYVDKFDKPAELEYTLPALVGPNEGELVSGNNFTPLLEVPAIINAKKLTTVIWSLLSGLVIYWLLRLLVRKRLAALLHPLVKNVNAHLVDEICYRAVAIGFPIFSLGALIFAMIWAQLAWTRFWGWDPKEVWALITWLFYAAFLHLRLSKGWHGEKSAWLAVIGFAVIMFNLVAVNLVVAGLHSYAG